MAIVFILLTVLGGMSTISSIGAAVYYNQVGYMVLAIALALLTWLFAYMAENTQL